MTKESKRHTVHYEGVEIVDDPETLREQDQAILAESARVQEELSELRHRRALLYRYFAEVWGMSGDKIGQRTKVTRATAYKLIEQGRTGTNTKPPAPPRSERKRRRASTETQ